MREVPARIYELCVQAVLLVVVVLILPVLILTDSYDTQVYSKRRIKAPGRLLTIRVVLDYILGNYRRPSYEVSAEYGTKYGDNLIGRFPFYRDAFLNVMDLDVAKDVMGSSVWLNRVAETHYAHTMSGGKPVGLVFGCGEYWQQSRRITLKILHQLDFFRTSKMESQILFEINELKADLLARMKGKGGSLCFSPQHMFEVATMNSVCQALIGQRFEPNDPVISDIIQSVNLANRQFSIGYSPVEFLRFLRHWPLFYLVTFLRSSYKCSMLIRDFFKRAIDERRKTETYKKLQPVDFVDYFLLEIDKIGGSSPYVTDEALLAVLRDLILGGMDTVASTLEHALLHMSLKPEIQRRVQREIDEVIGTRSPAYEDRTRMIYTQAVLLETLRVASVLPFTGRSPTEDTELEGFHIPKGSLCGINIYGIHRSPKLWNDPEDFQPERFLSCSSTGQVGDNPTIVNTEKMIPFGFGKRNCVGETLARCTLFIFFVSMMQSFTFRISDSHSPPSMENVPGFSRGPMPYFVVAEPRSVDHNSNAAEL